MIKAAEYSYEQAWNIIQAIHSITLSDEYIAIVFMQSYLNQKLIKQHITKTGYNNHLLQFHQFKKPHLLKILPIATPTHFILYDIKLDNIYQLATACHDFLMFELLILKSTQNDDDIKNQLLRHTPIFYSMDFIKNTYQSYFFCGFDFDDPNFESGVSKVAEYTFIPTALKKYFWS